MNISKAENLALDLMQKHDLYSWKFQFDRAKIRFGYCNYTNKIISLSRHLVELNNEEQVIDTILHEIAHALVGKKNNHNKIWKEKAKEIGCSSTRCYCSSKVIVPKRKYTAYCKSCKIEFQTQRKRKNAACKKCCKKYNKGKYSKEYLIEYKLNKKQNMFRLRAIN